MSWLVKNNIFVHLVETECVFCGRQKPNIDKFSEGKNKKTYKSQTKKTATRKTTTKQKKPVNIKKCLAKL